jgi:hypothetical protein
MRTTHPALFANNAIPMLIEHIDHLESQFWLNGERRVMHVLWVKCRMEGAGALIDHGFKDDHTLQAWLTLLGRLPIPSWQKGSGLSPIGARANRLGWQPQPTVWTSSFAKRTSARCIKWLSNELLSHLGITNFDAIHGTKDFLLLKEQGHMHPRILAPVNHSVY